MLLISSAQALWTHEWGHRRLELSKSIKQVSTCKTRPVVQSAMKGNVFLSLQRRKEIPVEGSEGVALVQGESACRPEETSCEVGFDGFGLKQIVTRQVIQSWLQVQYWLESCCGHAIIHQTALCPLLAACLSC